MKLILTLHTIYNMKEAKTSLFHVPVHTSTDQILKDILKLAKDKLRIKLKLKGEDRVFQEDGTELNAQNVLQILSAGYTLM